MRYRSILLAATALAAAPAIASAQAPAPGQAAPAARPPAQRPAPPPGAQRPQTVEGVVVQGSNTTPRTAIDRNSYSVANDLQAKTGSISDALRNVPSVQVDAQGNVSLRGDSSVQIMIDGKPSAMFEGEGRAQALEQLPADQIERVEVLTNPSASVRADGTGGIINLVTKKAVRQQGYNGSVRLNLGDAGRQSGGVSGSMRKGKLTLSGDLNGQHMGQKMVYTDDRARPDSTGAMIETHETGASFGSMNLVQGRAAFDYDIDPKTRISGELRGMAFDFGVDNPARFRQQNAAGQTNLILDRFSRVEQDRQNLSATGTYRRRFNGDDHELVASQTLEHTKSGFDAVTPIVTVQPAGAPNRLDGTNNNQELWMARTKVDYTRPTATKSQLKTGFELQFDNNDYSTFGFNGQGSTPPLPNPSRSYAFAFDQAIASGYVTYQQPVGKLTVLGGLRLEQVTQDLQLSGAAKTENDYFRAYPSLHVSYPLTGDLNAKVSYSRRIQRPDASELNPFVIYVDQFNRRSGNADLKPQITDAYEAEFQYRKGGAFYMATAYYRDRSKEVTDVTRILPGGIFLQTRDNLGDSRSAGVEVVANGRLTPKITYNVSGNLAWTEIDGSNLGFTDKRSDVALSGRGSVNWQVTPSDFVQFSGFLNGKRLTPQGYLGAQGILNVGYRHKFTDRFSVAIAANDVLSTMRFHQVVDTPTLKLDTDRDFKARGVRVGFVYAFGGSPQRQRDPGFDFGAAGPTGN